MSRLGALATVLTVSVLGVVTAALPASAALDKKAPASPQSEINTVVSFLNSGLHSTYNAQYSADYSGVSQTITMAQTPPKSLFKMIGAPIEVGSEQQVGSVLEVDTGSKTYGCNIEKTPAICFVQSTGSSYVPEEDTFRPSAVIFALEVLAGTLKSSASGTSVTTSTQRFGGQSASCVTIQATQPRKYCATKTGVLAFVSTSGNTLQLKQVSTSAPKSLFKLPAGAQIEAVNGALPPA